VLGALFLNPHLLDQGFGVFRRVVFHWDTTRAVVGLLERGVPLLEELQCSKRANRGDGG
jgi:hypothetical protein